jgi:hypothetical protein
MCRGSSSTPVHERGEGTLGKLLLWGGRAITLFLKNGRTTARLLLPSPPPLAAAPVLMFNPAKHPIRGRSFVVGGNVVRTKGEPLQ